MLCCALLLLAAGVVAPVYARNVFGAGLSAFSLGATFMGITVLVNLEARALFPHTSNRAIGRLTAAFGIGQIAGPLIVTGVVTSGGSYDVALQIDGVVLLAAAASAAVGGLHGHPRQSPEQIDNATDLQR
jgi:hypothetical protein